MTSAEQTALGKTLAGVNQYKILSAVMQNFSTAIDANNTALNSSGSATQENAAYMDSLQAKITNLKATYENIILGDGGIADFAKKMLDGANSILKFIDYGNNLQAVLGAIVGVLITIKAQKVSSMITTMIQPLKQLTTILAQNLLKSLPSIISHLAGYRGNILAVATAENTATVATSGLKLSLDTLTAGIGILTTVISLIVMASNKAQQAQEQAQQQQISNLQTYTETADKYKDLEQQLNKTSLTQEEFNSIIKNNPEIWGEYRGEVEKTSESLTKYKQILDSVAAGKAEDTFRSNVGEFKSAVNRNYSDKNTYGGVGWASLGVFAKDAGTSLGQAGIGRSSEDVLKFSAGSIDEMIQKLKAYQDELNSSAKSEEYSASQQAKFSKQADATGLIIGQLTQQKEQDLEVMKAMVAAYDAAPEKLSQYKDIVEQARDAIKDSEPAQKETTKTVAEMAAELGLTEEQFNAFAKSQKMSTNQAYDWIKTVQESTKNAKSLSDTLSEANSNLDLATKAYKELNKNGAVNADTMQQLLSLDYKYLSALIDSNGQININSQSLQTMSELMKNDAIENLKAAAAKDVVTIATKNSSEASDLAQGAIKAMNGEMESTSLYAMTAAGDLTGFTTAVMQAAAASKGKEIDVSALGETKAKEIKAVVQSYFSVAQGISKISIASTTNTKATHKNTTAKEINRKKNKELSEEIDRQTKKLEKQKDKLQDNIDAWNDQAEEMEKLFSIVIDRIEEKIDKLQEKNDKYQEKIDARTEKFEKAKEKEEKALDKKIDAIDKEIAAQQEANDAVDDAIELQEKLENLRKAQSTKVKVFKDGQWTWGTDQAAVDEAQKELDEYNRAKAQENAIAELERAKELLETQKDSLDAKYEALIANDKLINKWQSIIDKNNEEIALLEKQKKEVEDISKMYERMEENAILKKYLDTDKIFGTKGLKHSVIPTLQKVENEYINIQDYIKDAEEEVKRFEKAISGLNDLSSQVGNSEGSISGGWVQRQIDKWLNKINPKRKSKKKKKHASGVANIANDEIALVGESPYEEMIIGSKYNTGTVAQLSKGSGVVNAAATNTLAGILNTFAKSNFGAGNGVLNNNSRDLSTIINISNLNVETQNGEQFVNYLQDFAMKMRQESYKNK